MSGAFNSSTPSQLEVTLDGLPVVVPLERRSFAGIRSYLDTLALQQQRVLCALSVNGEQVNLTQSRYSSEPLNRIEAETMSLTEVPVQLIKAARQQAAGARARVQSAVELVLINDRQRAQELWWGISTALKEPLLTLSLLPETICGPATGGASLIQLRKWQLQQLGCVIRDVDEACQSEDLTVLSDALEQRALPWLDKLDESLGWWLETISVPPSTASQPYHS